MKKSNIQVTDLTRHASLEQLAIKTEKQDQYKKYNNSPNDDDKDSSAAGIVIQVLIGIFDFFSMSYLSLPQLDGILCLLSQVFYNLDSCWRLDSEA